MAEAEEGEIEVSCKLIRKARVQVRAGEDPADPANYKDEAEKLREEGTTGG